MRLHPNILENLRFRFKQELGYACKLCEAEIAEIYDTYHTLDSGSQEEDAIIAAMKAAHNG